MRLAVIDMGTNTFNLLIADCFSNYFSVLYSDKYSVKLGQRLRDKHIISEYRLNKIIQTLSAFLNEIKKHSAHKIIAVATSSIRTAQNQNEVLMTIKEKLNIDVQVIDGEREAQLICYANQYAIKMGAEPHLIMDIGGGSTEFVIANQYQVFWKHSFLLGMARLIDEIKPNDPIHSSDIDLIYNYLDKMLYPLKESVNKYYPKNLIGSSGVFDSIVEMIDANIRAVKKSNSACEISINDFYTIYNQLIPLSYEERLKFKGLIPMRADMIVVSLVLIDYVLKKYSIEKIKISFYSLKEGVVIEEINKVNPDFFLY